MRKTIRDTDMRTILIITMFAASLAHADWKDYEEVRELTLDASGFDELRSTRGPAAWRSGVALVRTRFG